MGKRVSQSLGLVPLVAAILLGGCSSPEVPLSNTSAEPTTFNIDASEAEGLLDAAGVPKPAIDLDVNQPVGDDVLEVANIPCPDVNGFSVDIVRGNPECTLIRKDALDYTEAVLANTLGRELQWSGMVFSCLRNFDPTGTISNAKGMICIGEPGDFILIFNDNSSY
jgi:hypothetical protein